LVVREVEKAPTPSDDQVAAEVLTNTATHARCKLRSTLSGPDFTAPWAALRSHIEHRLRTLLNGFTRAAVSAGAADAHFGSWRINLAHGSLYMVGAYAAALTTAKTGSFLLAIPAGLGAAGSSAC
jgi:hypothetical protein